ncbi:DUF378 domain-containing protein [Psychrobacillus antarcticus]|uniref:DUF378 domain-containing protein n=1 Tax=Psychrobacillus antarcticus TaxID=2879115 RepID=UPI002407EA31|nr:DUF378 domain-containing protein [Psychrobacillus antarcticus]
MGFIRRLALALVIIGAINWGLIGFFEFDLVASIFGGQTALFSKVIYALVGISGLVCIPLLFLPDTDEVVEPRGTGDYRNLQTEFGDEPEFKDINEETLKEKELKK